MSKKNVIDLFMSRKGIIRAEALCPRCGGAGFFLGGETCYYCKGKGTVD